jgi:hypothetical protein
MYQEFLNEASSSHGKIASVTGDMPSNSDGEAYGYPPSGEQLLEMHHKESRAAEFFQEAYKPEVIEGTQSAIERNVTGLQELFEHPPTGSRADVPASPSLTVLHSPENVSVSDLTMATLTFGMLAFEAGRWVHSKLEALRSRRL